MQILEQENKYILRLHSIMKKENENLKQKINELLGIENKKNKFKE